MRTVKELENERNSNGIKLKEMEHNMVKLQKDTKEAAHQVEIALISGKYSQKYASGATTSNCGFVQATLQDLTLHCIQSSLEN